MPDETKEIEVTTPVSVPAPREDQYANGRLQTVRRLIAPLSKEQLIELIATAALDSETILTAATKMVSTSPASRRLMIRNIAFSTKDSDFVNLFSSFGGIDDAAIVRDKEGRSRGYGFVTCKSGDSVKTILESPLTLDGRNLLAKLAGDPFADFISGGDPEQAGKGSRRKLFIRNLSQATDSDVLREIFQIYGELEECVVVSDAEGKSRGYGFVTFVFPESAIRAVQEPQRIINNRVAFVSFATPSRFRNSQLRASPKRNANNRYRMVQQQPQQQPVLTSANLSNMYHPYSPQAYPAMMPSFFGGPGHVDHLSIPAANYVDYMNGTMSAVNHPYG